MDKRTFKKTVLALSLTLLSAEMAAAGEVPYHIAGQRQTVMCKSDGRNIWCPATRGLVLGGDAVVDGDWYFLRGEPDAIDGSINGRSVTFIKGRMPSTGPGYTDGEDTEDAFARQKTRLVKVKDRKGRWVKKQVTVRQQVSPDRHPDDIDGEPRLSIAERMARNKGEAAAMDMDGPGHWKLSMGEKIPDAITRWANRSGWQVAYEGPDVTSRVDVTLGGSFESAITELIEALNRSGTAIRADFYDQNRVLRVTGNGGF